jgi:RimJ/RimL family protein N-acetyltransferase
MGANEGVISASPISNALGQPIGPFVPGWTDRLLPSRAPMQGRFCRLEALDPARHAESLHEANRLDADGRNWTYLFYGPFDRFAEYRAWAEAASRRDDPLFYAIVDQKTGLATGVASYLRIDAASGAIEVGHLNFSALLQRTPAATEAMYLMMRRAFDGLGYRRYEWKCDALNAPSRAAAARLGFRFEGIHRQAVIYKGRSRDTAWFSILDHEWPALRAGFERWLSSENFDAAGRQRAALAVKQD